MSWRKFIYLHVKSIQKTRFTKRMNDYLGWQMLYTGKFYPCFIFALLSSGEMKTGLIELYIHVKDYMKN